MPDTFGIFETGFSVLFDVPEINLGGPGSLVPIRIPGLTTPIDLLIPNSDAKNTWLYAHHVWKASILLSRLMVIAENDPCAPDVAMGSFKGKTVLELGAGTGLPSIIAVKLGAQRVVASDYPDETILKTLSYNMSCNLQGSAGGLWAVAGHIWGTPTTELLTAGQAPLAITSSGLTEKVVPSASVPLNGEVLLVNGVVHTLFDIILLADTFWMEHQHDNLLADIKSLLSPSGIVWAVAGLHTGISVMRRFFEKAQRDHGLKVDLVMVVLVPIGSGSGEDIPWNTVPLETIGDIPDTIEERKRFLFVYRMSWK
ncbi:hypothetical protein BASA62_007398 [Batrachochytrium salamandrivorans]|nr:hypothetical protein BASA62_007398 [Batrachochytrium salamandrivorans]